MSARSHIKTPDEHDITDPQRWDPPQRVETGQVPSLGAVSVALLAVALVVTVAMVAAAPVSIL